MSWQDTSYAIPLSLLALFSAAVAWIAWQRRLASGATGLSLQKYRTLVEASNDAIFLETLDGKVLDCNEAACAMHGYRKEELIGLTAEDLVAPDAVPHLEGVVAEEIVKGWSRFEFTGRRKSGELFPSEVSTRLISLEDEPLVIVYVRDITERKQAEEEQRQHEHFLTLLNDMTRLALETSDFQATLQALADQMGEFIAADATYITLWDETTQLAVPAAATGHLRDRYTSLHVEPGEPTVTAAVLDQGQAIAIEDTQNTPFINPRIADSIPGRSMLGLPLIAGGRKLGAALITHNEPHIHSPQEIEQGMQMARQIALAIAKAQLLEETRRRATQQEALNKVIVAAASAQSLAELLDVTLDQILEATHLEQGALWVADQWCSRNVDGDLLMDVSAWLDRACPAGQPPRTTTVWDWQAEELEPTLSALSPVMERQRVRASLLAAIPTENGPAGGLALFSASRRPWLADEVALLEGVGGQLGSAAQRLQLIERVRKQAEQLQQVIQAVPEGMVLLDGQQRVLLTNPAGARLLKILSNARAGDAVTQLGEWPIANLLERPPAQSSHELVMQGDGPAILVIDAHPVALGPAEDGWILMIDDVTQKRQAQELAQRQQRLAAIGQLASGIAHDFNNILQSIIGFADLLRFRSDFSDADQRRIELIAQQGRRGAALVRQILDFSRQSTSRRRRIDLAALLQETVEMLRSTLPPSIQLQVEAPQQVQPIFADSGQLQQVLLNLCNNARDAMPEGGQLTLRLEGYEPGSTQAPAPPRPGHWLLLTIGDTGHGIEAGDLPHIFEPFFTTKLVGLGTGLGLAQAYGIIEQHDGAIQVSSQPGQGAHFFIYLPIAKAPVYDAEAEGDGGFGLLEPAVVLLVEAKADLADQLFQCLEMAGYRAIPANSGREALEILQEGAGAIDLVLADVALPGTDGVELAGQIYSQYPAIPVLLLGNHPLWEEIKHRHSNAIASTIPTPFSDEEVIEVVRKALVGRKP